MIVITYCVNVVYKFNTLSYGLVFGQGNLQNIYDMIWMVLWLIGSFSDFQNLIMVNFSIFLTLLGILIIFFFTKIIIFHGILF